jgi:hypothetical protein
VLRPAVRRARALGVAPWRRAEWRGWGRVSVVSGAAGRGRDALRTSVAFLRAGPRPIAEFINSQSKSTMAQPTVVDGST